MDSFAKIVYYLKSLTSHFNKKLHIKIHYAVLKNSFCIVNFIKCYLIARLCVSPSRRYIYGSFCFLTRPTGCSSQVFVYNCYADIIFNFYYFIAVPIGKTCSRSLLRFSNSPFYIVFFFIADFKQVFTMF